MTDQRDENDQTHSDDEAHEAVNLLQGYLYQAKEFAYFSIHFIAWSASISFGFAMSSSAISSIAVISREFKAAINQVKGGRIRRQLWNRTRGK